MVSVDTSTFVAYLEGSIGPDVDFLERLLSQRLAVFTPPVVVELLSEPSLTRSTEQVLLRIPVLSVLDGYWERAGRLRRQVLAAHRKAKLGDTLIAQSCIDHGLMLLTRDADFQTFVQHSTLLVWQPPTTAN